VHIFGRQLEALVEGLTDVMRSRGYSVPEVLQLDDLCVLLYGSALAHAVSRVRGDGVPGPLLPALPGLPQNGRGMIGYTQGQSPMSLRWCGDNDEAVRAAVHLQAEHAITGHLDFLWARLCGHANSRSKRQRQLEGFAAGNDEDAEEAAEHGVALANYERAANEFVEVFMRKVATHGAVERLQDLWNMGAAGFRTNVPASSTALRGHLTASLGGAKYNMNTKYWKASMTMFMLNEHGLLLPRRELTEFWEINTAEEPQLSDAAEVQPWPVFLGQEVQIGEASRNGRHNGLRPLWTETAGQQISVQDRVRLLRCWTSRMNNELLAVVANVDVGSEDSSIDDGTESESNAEE
jgi:hypothetical protein